MIIKEGKTNIKYLFIIIILAAIVGGGILWFSQQQIPSYQSSEIKIPEKVKDETADWLVYQSPSMGFSIKIPPTERGLNRCIDKGETEVNFSVPLKVFEDNKNSVVYIVPEYYYDFNSKTGPTGAAEQVGPCKKIEYDSLDSLNASPSSPYYSSGGSLDPFAGRAIHIGGVNNDNDIVKFLNNTYDGECFIRSRELWGKQEGVYKLEVSGEIVDSSEDRPTLTCPIGMNDVVLYASGKGKAMFLDMGQECAFVDVNWNCYDFKMIDSFRFK